MLNKLLKKISKKTSFNISGIKKYSENFSYLIGEYVFALISSLIVGIAVARYLGPESYGIITFALSVYAICVIIVSLGIDDILYQDIISKKYNRNIIEGTALFLKTIIAILVYIIVFVYGYISLSEEKFKALIIINFALIFQPLSVFSLIFLSRAEGKYTSIARIISYSLSSILKIILVIINADLIYFALAILLDSFILYVIVTFIYKQKGYNNIKLKVDYNYIVVLLQKSQILFFNILFFTAFLKYNNIYISYNFGDFDTGIYNAALRLTEAFYLIPTVIVTAFFPAIVNAKNIGEEEYVRRISMLFYVFTILFIGISVIVTILSSFIINILYGEKYEYSYIILAFTIWSIPFILFYNITNKYFIVENKINHILFRSFVSFALLIIFNFLFFKYQIVGTAISFVLSSFISFYMIDIFFKDSRQLFIIKTRSIFLPLIYIINILKKSK